MNTLSWHLASGRDIRWASLQKRTRGKLNANTWFWTQQEGHRWNKHWYHFSYRSILTQAPMIKPFGHQKAEILACTITSLTRWQISVESESREAEQCLGQQIAIQTKLFVSSSCNKSQSLSLHQIQEKSGLPLTTTAKESPALAAVQDLIHVNYSKGHPNTHINLQRVLALGLACQAWRSIGCQGCSFVHR